MKNYIYLNGSKINLTEEQVKEMQKSFGIKPIKLSDISTGETFKIGEYEFIAMEHSKETTSALLKAFLHDEKAFGKNNNYNGSYIDDMCNDFARTISDIVGDENLIEHTVDLTSDDGLKDYGKIKRKVSLLTTDLYRRYVETLDKYNPKKYWWLVTAYSTPAHSASNWVKCVSPGGVIYIGLCSSNNGVRPFCILKSNILVSK